MFNCTVCRKPIFQPPNTEETYVHMIDGKWAVLIRSSKKIRVDRSFHFPDRYNVEIQERLKVYE